MFSIRQILCPTDFSDTALHGLEHAIAIAAWYESRVTILHVHHWISPTSIRPPDADQQRLVEQLRIWAAPAAASGMLADLEVVQGNPAAMILDRASSLPADLIVMGTHGRAGFDRLLLGSVTEKVLRKANSPVLTVPPPSVSTSKLPFKRLLCPVDFSAPSLSALRFALSIAKESDADVTVLRVFELWEDVAIPELLLEDRRRLADEARREIDSLISDEERDWCKPTIQVSFGRAYLEILAVAEHQKADLIVMGVHGRSALDRTLFGSTTSHVVRQSRCPVLTLRN